MTKILMPSILPHWSGGREEEGVAAREELNGDENRIDSLSRDTPVITNKKYIQVSSLSFTTWKLKVHITES